MAVTRLRFLWALSTRFLASCFFQGNLPLSNQETNSFPILFHFVSRLHTGGVFMATSSILIR
jgi:hypothetical protein